jgi:hypothetical protein
VAFKYEQLDDLTRKWMMVEFESEQANGLPYFGKVLSPTGRAAFPNLMRAAIANGNEETLARSLAAPRYWLDSEPYERNGVLRIRNVNVVQAAERLAATEFNTWYVRGLTRRAIEEGIQNCEVYRAAEPKWQPAECANHEGVRYSVKDVYAGHRAKYWPEPGNPAVTSVPFGPGCHHTVRLLVNIPVVDQN